MGLVRDKMVEEWGESNYKVFRVSLNLKYRHYDTSFHVYSRWTATMIDDDDDDPAQLIQPHNFATHFSAKALLI